MEGESLYEKDLGGIGQDDGAPPRCADYAVSINTATWTNKRPWRQPASTPPNLSVRAGRRAVQALPSLHRLRDWPKTRNLVLYSTWKPGIRKTKGWEACIDFACVKFLSSATCFSPDTNRVNRRYSIISCLLCILTQLKCRSMFTKPGRRTLSSIRLVLPIIYEWLKKIW